MNVIAERGNCVDGFDDLAGEIVGMRSGEAHAADSRHLGDGAQQVDKIQPARRGIAIGIDGLAEQLNFGVAGVGEAARFGENGVARAAALGTARVRHDAIGAGVVAAFDDGDVGADGIVAAGDFGFKSFVGVEIEARDAAAARFELVHQLREASGSWPSRRRD